VVGAAVTLMNVALVYDTKSFFEAFDMAAVGAEAESPLAASLIVNMSIAWSALGFLCMSSAYRGSQARFRMGLAMAFVLATSIYADFEMPFEFAVDEKGHITDTPVPNDMSSMRFIVKTALLGPLALSLLAHCFEPGLLTKDKSAKKKTA